MVMNDVEDNAKNFIENNNIFLNTGDSFFKWVAPPIQGEITYGIPNVKVNIEKTKGAGAIMHPNQIMYQCQYSFDEVGRRSTSKIGESKIEVALFFGDAIVFGEGVNDYETIATYYERLNPKCRSYNYGFSGHGPTHMLRQVSSLNFKNQFKNKKGVVYYILRDDAVKSTVGQVPWAQGTPKYTYNSYGNLEYSGTYNQSDCVHEKIYLPSQFSEQDHTLTADIFKEIQKNVIKTSIDLKVFVVILPLTFSFRKICKLFRDRSIKYKNFFYTDLDYLTEQTARFIDGAHTPQSNYIIARKLTEPYKENLELEETELNSTVEEKQYKDILRRNIFMLPSTSELPPDDAGVLIAQILKNYKHVNKISNKELELLSKKWFVEKIKLIKDLQLLSSNTSRLELLTKYEYFKDDALLLSLFIKEYIDSRYLLTVNIP